MYKITLLITFMISSLFSFSQQKPDRPKVGLVLSGGGAKGFAHVGAIKALEGAGVKIDFITGTSMGAVIGGLYASGYTGQQLDSIFEILDSNAIVNDYPVTSSRVSYDKHDEDKYALTLPVKDFNLTFPEAYSKGLYNYSFLMEMTMHVRHIRDFSKLPIPFACVAHDIQTGEEVVLKKGNLAKAMVASSAFPSLYYPVTIGDKRLVDGGVINNFPVEELRKMGADIIIGVNVQADLTNKSDSESNSTAIVMKIANFDMMKKMHEKEKLVDILIEPDISEFTFFSFKEGRKLIEVGEAGVKEKWDEFKAKIPHLDASYRPEKTVKAVDSLYINEIKVNELNYYNRDYVVGKLFFKPYSKIATKKLFEGIVNLNSTKNFEQIDYRLDKQDNLIINLTEDKNNTYLRMGLHYDPVFQTGVLLNVTSKHLLLTNDVLSMDFVLGDTYRWLIDYYIDNGYNWSFGSRLRYTQFNYNLNNNLRLSNIIGSVGVNKENIDFDDISGEIYAQKVLFKKVYSSLGFEGKYLRLQSNTLNDGKGVYENDLMLNIFGRMTLGGLDKRYFPKKGVYFKGQYQAYLFSYRYLQSFEPFYMGKADFGGVIPLSSSVSCLLQSEGGFTIQNYKSPYLNFILGGYGYKEFNNFRHFYGYDFFTLSGDSYVKATLTLDYNFKKRHHFNFAANFANLGQDIFDNGEWATLPDYTGYAIGYGLETFFGPIELKKAWSPESKSQYWLINIGASF